MNMHISRTEPGTKSYPPHVHDWWEIMSYSKGTGYLYTPEKNYSFSPGAVILVPPHIIHGSVSENGFTNISIGGTFENIIFSDSPIVISDNSRNECLKLTEIIYNNRFSNKVFLTKICTAYVYFLLEHMYQSSDIAQTVNNVISQITSNAFDSNINLCKILSRSSYAEDYIRSHFKKIVGKTPTQFLNDIRMEHARFLINVYGKNLSLSEIAEKCGFEDYIYFSKQFKKKYNISPREYLRHNQQIIT